MNKKVNSPQFRDGKFRNFVDWERPSFTKLASGFWEFIVGGVERTPSKKLAMTSVDLSLFSEGDQNQLNVTWLGHSSLMININGYKILTDPVFEKKVSFFGPTRYNGDVPLDIYALPEIDLIICSHNHYDHLNKFSIQTLNERTKMFAVPVAVGAKLEEWGVPRSKIVEMDWWDEFQYDEDLLIAATPAQHFSGRGLMDRDKTLWASWVIKTRGHNVFFGGDSGYFEGFRLIGERYGPFDMTFLECGAYNERWHHMHMFPEETAQAHLDLKGEILQPIHWGTFNLSLHSWFEPMERLTAAAESLQIRTATPIVGETTIFDIYIPAQKWWEREFAIPD